LERIAIISDVHGNILALEEVVADIKRRGIGTIVNLGDHLSGPLWPKETIQYLMSKDWIHISGNHDRHLTDQVPERHGLSDQYAFRLLDDAEKQWLRALPPTIRLHNDLFLFHGAPSNDSVYLLETIEHGRARLATKTEIKQRLGNAESRVMLCGHTHIPRVVNIDEGILIVNPGSVGLPAYEDSLPEPHVMETGSPHARYAILEHENNRWIVELKMVPYDHQKAAQQARKNNRSDWQLGLQTGYMST
jgi:predicted phosphodiesterase